MQYMQYKLGVFSICNVRSHDVLDQKSKRVGGLRVLKTQKSKGSQNSLFGDRVGHQMIRGTNGASGGFIKFRLDSQC